MQQNDHQDRDLDVLQAEAARRRTELEQSLGRLTDCLSPASAAAAVRDAGHETAAQALDAVRKNPSVLAWLGGGAAALLLAGRSARAGHDGDPADAAARRGLGLGNGSADASAGAAGPLSGGQAGSLALGAAALGAGALAAALLPRTRQEDELLGPVGTKLSDTVRSFAQQAMPQGTSPDGRRNGSSGR